MSAPRESAAGQEQSAALSAEPPAVRLDALLFGETQSRIVISAPPHHAAKILAQARILEIPATKLGVVGGSTLRIKTSNRELSWDLADLHDLWWNAIARAME